MPLSLGDSAPDFALPGTDGKTWSLADFESTKALVVIFSCNHCPYVQAYEGRIKALQAEYGAEGAQVVAINANETEHYPEDSFEQMVARAKAEGFNFPYLRDDSQEVARAYGAERTPHIFMFDAGRTLVYTGGIDDNYKDEAAVTRTYLKDAVSELLAGKRVSEPTTSAIGCSVKWNS